MKAQGEVPNGHMICDRENEDGDCVSEHEDTDTVYTPWFSEEHSPWAAIDIMPRLAQEPLVMVEGYPIPRQYFADRLAPEDWGNYLFEWGSVPAFHGAIDNVLPQDWIRIKTAIDTRSKVVVGNVYHTYPNFVHADDQENIFKPYEGHIPEYKALGVLPVMKNIYSSTGGPVGYDYDFVQFLDGVKPSESESQWQQVASTWAANAGKLQASLILFFVQDSKITNREEFISTTKAWLMQKDVFDKRILPKNLILIGCGVTPDNKTIRFCRMETGMYTGNHRIEVDIASLSDMPFTIRGVFGELNSDSYGEPDSNGVYKTNVAFGEEGFLHLLFRPEPDGFTRVHMADMEFLKTDIKPDPNQVMDILNHERILGFAFALFVLVFGVVAITYVSSKS
jgi:hypothetical protein